MSILVDTGAWYALANGSDDHHNEARTFFTQRARTTPFLTTDLILAETWALLTSHLGRQAALRFWAGLRETRIPILTPDPPDPEAAWRIAHAFPDQAFSLVDCMTFAIMERLEINDAFTFDAHFLVYRFGADRQRAFRRFPN